MLIEPAFGRKLLDFDLSALQLLLLSLLLLLLPLLLLPLILLQNLLLRMLMLLLLFLLRLRSLIRSIRSSGSFHCPAPNPITPSLHPAVLILQNNHDSAIEHAIARRKTEATHASSKRLQ